MGWSGAQQQNVNRTNVARFLMYKMFTDAKTEQYHFKNDFIFPTMQK